LHIFSGFSFSHCGLQAQALRNFQGFIRQSQAVCHLGFNFCRDILQKYFQILWRNSSVYSSHLSAVPGVSFRRKKNRFILFYFIFQVYVGLRPRKSKEKTHIYIYKGEAHIHSILQNPLICMLSTHLFPYLLFSLLVALNFCSLLHWAFTLCLCFLQILHCSYLHLITSSPRLSPLRIPLSAATISLKQPVSNVDQPRVLHFSPLLTLILSLTGTNPLIAAHCCLPIPSLTLLQFLLSICS